MVHSILLGYEKVYTFPKGISLKLRTIVRLKFDLSCYDVTVMNINHYITGILNQKKYQFNFIE